MNRMTGLVAAVSAMAALAACTNGTGADKAGGQAEPVVLQLANGSSGLDYFPAVENFVTRVAEASAGRLRIEVKNAWGDFAPDFEQRIVQDVAAGKADLGWSGTRVFDTLGVTSFQALTAPMLIDSYALQGAVLASDIPGQMVRGLEPLGVTGLAVLAGGLRRPIAAKHPLLAPSDWRDIKIEARRSATWVNTIRALGATPIELQGPGGPARSEALATGKIDATELNLLTWLLATDVSRAPYVSANVILWPYTGILLANPQRLSRLTKEQRGWLATAAADAAAQSAQLADQDSVLAVQACGSGAQFVNASTADLDALRQAFAPVYTELVRDPQTKSFIDRIDALKASTPREPPLAIPVGCPTVVAATAVAGTTNALDGVYRWTLTSDDAKTHGTANQALHEYPSTFTMTLQGGRWEGRQTAEPGVGSGTFGVSGDRISFDWPQEGIVLSFTFTVGTNGDLTLRPILPMNPGDQFVWSTHPWTKIG